MSTFRYDENRKILMTGGNSYAFSYSCGKSFADSFGSAYDNIEIRKVSGLGYILDPTSVYLKIISTRPILTNSCIFDLEDYPIAPLCLTYDLVKTCFGFFYDICSREVLMVLPNDLDNGIVTVIDTRNHNNRFSFNFSNQLPYGQSWLVARASLRGTYNEI